MTTFEETETRAVLGVAYSLSNRRGAVRITVDFAGLPDDGITEVVVMNELGALHFDRYTDSDGAGLRGAEMGTWSRVAAAQASLLSATARAAFPLEQVEGARSYRGREPVGERLAWCGFGYSLSPSARSFNYDVAIGAMPMTTGAAHLPILRASARPLAVPLSPTRRGLCGRQPAAGGPPRAASRLHVHEPRRSRTAGHRGARRGGRHLLPGHDAGG